MRSAIQQATSILTAQRSKVELAVKQAQIEARYRRRNDESNALVFHTAAGWWHLAVTSNSQVHLSLIPAPVGFIAKTWTTGGKRAESGQRIMFENIGKTAHFPSGDVL